MKSVMISIQPKWCELIASGKKTVEVRKTRPKIETPFKCYIYCTNNGGTLHSGYKGLYYHQSYIGKNDASCINGKVIGEFVCDSIQAYESEFVDDDCYENIASLDYEEETGFIEWSNDSDFPYESTDFYKKSCVKYEELKKYMGFGINQFYGWHISDLVIYDKPKELHHFFKPCGDCDKKGTKRCTEELTDCRAKVITRPPQSWCYVETQ